MVTIHLTNKWLYSIGFFVLLLGIGGLVYALAPGEDPVGGHAATELSPPSPCPYGYVLTWETNSWACREFLRKDGGNIYEYQLYIQNVPSAYALYVSGGTIYSVMISGDLRVSGTCSGGASCDQDIAEYWVSESALQSLHCGDDKQTYIDAYEGLLPDEKRALEDAPCVLDPAFVPEFETGDVICFDRSMGSTSVIKPCEGAYDKTVLSVINEEATLTIGPKYYPYPVSLAGNVPVKVICDKPISLGDSLVTSSVAGYAMKLDVSDVVSFQDFQDRNDAVFAKALEPCDSGEAIIRAWV